MVLFGRLAWVLYIFNIAYVRLKMGEHEPNMISIWYVFDHPKVGILESISTAD